MKGAAKAPPGLNRIYLVHCIEPRQINVMVMI